ncbi:MAG: hypothetical protein ACKVQK_31470 [Burkholderiales bacterium]
MKFQTQELKQYNGVRKGTRVKVKDLKGSYLATCTSLERQTLGSFSNIIVNIQDEDGNIKGVQWAKIERV